jgi:hypothetical protein
MIYGSEEARRELRRCVLTPEAREALIARHLDETQGHRNIARAGAEHLSPGMMEDFRRDLESRDMLGRPNRLTPLDEIAPSGEEIRIMSEFPTPVHDTDYLALPGKLPKHSMVHYASATELVAWSTPGTWVREKTSGRVGKIASHFKTRDQQGRSHLHVLVDIWHSQEQVDLCAHWLVTNYEACQEPVSPTMWDHLLLDEDL